MLLRLAIRNFVLVDQLELEFQPGFSVLTGETGAGKSILIDALAIVLGERTDTGVIRNGCDRAEINAEFTLENLPEAKSWLDEHDIDSTDQLIVRRVIDAGGRSRAYLNGTPTTAQQVREIAESLIDLHGQHTHQSLLRSDAQRELLDGYGNSTELAQQTRKAWQTWRAACDRLENARQAQNQASDQRDRLAWTVEELEKLAVAPGEWSALNEEHTRLAHAAQLLEGAQHALTALDGEAPGSLRIDPIAGQLEQLSRYDAELDEIVQLVESARAELSEAGSLLRRYVDRIDLDPARLGEVDTRLAALLFCARKYRVEPEELPELLVRSRRQLEDLTTAADLQALSAEADRCEAEYQQQATALGEQRRTAASQLGRAVSELMQQLALGNSRFEVALVPSAPGSHGNEQIEFRIAGLAQHEARPLSRVASGGELSRISLAIQVVASKAGRVPTLIFDEVDSGIGGSVAEVVGRLLHGLGRERQILCVTHLPQVAARADWQWQVKKITGTSQITSRVDPLDTAGRIDEIARMLGGMEITPLTRQHAEEMLRIDA